MIKFKKRRRKSLKAVLFYKENENLILKFNFKRFKFNQIIVFFVCLGIALFFYFSLYDLKLPTNEDHWVFPTLFFTMYAVALCYNFYRAYSMKNIFIEKDDKGYIAKKGSRIKTNYIKLVIKTHVRGKYNHGYLVAIKDIDNQLFTLFEELPEEDAQDVTLFLSTEMRVSIELIN